MNGHPKYILVIFDEASTHQQQDEALQEKPRLQQPETDLIIEQLETELQDLKEQLQATIEQHETSNEEQIASNEELQSINEELKSATEELETSKEELQTTNEKLITLNQEHKNKIIELAQANNDLMNLMASTDIGTLFLDRNQRIRRYTPRISELFNIFTSDVGRPLAHFTHQLGYDNLAEDVTMVLDKLTPVEREILSDAGFWYLVRLLPYRTLEEL